MPGRTLAQRAAAVGLTDRGSLSELALMGRFPAATGTAFARGRVRTTYQTAHPPITLPKPRARGSEGAALTGWLVFFAGA
jgi:hypothetical protein